MRIFYEEQTENVTDPHVQTKISQPKLAIDQSNDEKLQKRSSTTNKIIRLLFSGSESTRMKKNMKDDSENNNQSI